MGNIKNKLYDIIFEAETFYGKLFDILLIVAVIVSIACVSMESVASIKQKFGKELLIAEWFFTILFTMEYILRIFISPKAKSYVFSFFGIVDLLAILPTYLSFFIPGSQMLLTVRALRLLRVFRVLKLTRYTNAIQVLMTALKESRAKIIVFLWAVISVVIIIGSIMYLVEGAESGFTSIPKSVYWAIVTMTTVGYGDITPHTSFGQLIASLLMIMGYSLIAVPTGILTVELSSATHKNECKLKCHDCGKECHDLDAKFCNTCGKILA
jgi:voltage-gated potassium channel